MRESISNDPHFPTTTTTVHRRRTKTMKRTQTVQVFSGLQQQPYGGWYVIFVAARAAAQPKIKGKVGNNGWIGGGVLEECVCVCCAIEVLLIGNIVDIF